MNILYFAIASNQSSYSSTNKMKDQVRALGSLANSATLLLASAGHGLFRFHYNKSTKELELVETVPPLSTKQGVFSNAYQKYRYYSDIIPCYLNKICNEERITSLYCRKFPLFPNLIQALHEAKVMHSLSVCYEYPTYPYIRELLKGGSPIALLQELFFARSIERLVDHFFLITDDENAKKVPFRNWSRITNGIAVDRVPVRTSSPPLAKGLNLLGLANTAFWHGYDRVIKGLHNYNKASASGVTVRFHIAGLGPATKSLKELARGLGVEEQVVFHGPLEGADLNCLFDQCQIGVGGLGAHRKWLYESSALKTREYCARGLPFFIGVKDPDFSEDLGFIHYVPSDDTPVDIESILHFARGLEQDVSIPKKMREYASSHLDWTKPMEIVYRVFERLAEEKKQA